MTAKGAQVVGVSVDGIGTQKRFKEENQLPFPLLSDKDGTVTKQYAGTVPVFGVANRATFVIDQDGRVKEIVKGSDAIDPSSAVNACPMPRRG